MPKEQKPFVKGAKKEPKTKEKESPRLEIPNVDLDKVINRLNDTTSLVHLTALRALLNKCEKEDKEKPKVTTVEPGISGKLDSITGLLENLVKEQSAINKRLGSVEEELKTCKKRKSGSKTEEGQEN